MDDNIVYATAQSEPLSVDLGAVAYRGSRPPTACFKSKLRLYVEQLNFLIELIAWLIILIVR